MRKIIFMFFCLPIFTFGQQTYVPDDNFEAWIETTYPAADNGAVNDDYVLTAGLIITNNFSLNSAAAPGPIFDLTGIEDVQSQNITINNLLITELDLSDLSTDSISMPSWWNGSVGISVQSNQYLEEIILPNSNDTISINISSNDSLNNIVFQSGLSYTNITIASSNNLCELILKGKFVTPSWNNFSLSSCINITKVDFSDITSAPYQTGIQIGNLWSFDPSFNILASNFQQLNLNGPVSIYNWKVSAAFGNSGNPFVNPYYNYTPCIEVPSSSDVSYCAGSNEWPDSATYSTNCYTPVSCQVSTSISEISSQERELYKVIDILGRNSKGRTNQPLFYIYTDGTVEKRIVIE